MKLRASCLLLAAALPGSVLADEAVTILRRTEAKTGVVWDMPPTPQAAEFLASASKQRTALYEQWLLGGNQAESLVDQRIAGANLPSVRLNIRTLDPDGKTRRTRVDQGFNVDIEISGLLSGLDLPPSMSRLLLERQLVAGTGTSAAATPPQARGFLTDNGKTSLSFPASALTAADPTKAQGEEVFTVHTLTATGKLPTQLATARVQILPVASGSIDGIQPGATLDPSAPVDLTISLKDLYPTSETHLLLFKGRHFNGTEPAVLASCPIQSEHCENRSLTVTDLASRVTSEGYHTLALVSDTLYGRELLCAPITFQASPAKPPVEIAQSSQP
jgi:hypothetical protein